MGCGTSKQVDSGQLKTTEVPSPASGPGAQASGQQPALQQPLTVLGDGPPLDKAAAAKVAMVEEEMIKNAPDGASVEEITVEYAGAAPPLCELERRAHLAKLNILDTEVDQRFEDITRLCCMIFKVPIALVSLVDTNRQWFKSVQGLPGCSQTDRSSSFCAWTLLPAYPEALVVEDALEDARFKQNPLVQNDPFIRFYAGSPLVCSNGLRLGSLCIIDRAPRTFDAESCQVLANMSEMVVREIEKEQRLAEQKAQSAMSNHLLRAIDCFTEGIMLISMTPPRKWVVIYTNEAWERAVDLPRGAGQGRSFWDLFTLQAGDASRSSSMPSSASSAISSYNPGSTNGSVAADAARDAAAQFDSAISNMQNFELRVRFNPARQSGNLPAGFGMEPGRSLLLQFRCASNTVMDSHMPPIGIPNTLPSNQSAPVFYFATLSTHTSATEPGSVAAKQHRPPKKAFSLLKGEDPFSDIKLGPLLGKGAFGRVYRGTWNNAQVAVKVGEYTAAEDEDQSSLEGLLHSEISHPNVVQTYKHVCRPAHQHSEEMDLDDSFDGMGEGEMEPKRPRQTLMELWLVLEFCNKGCISDAVEKGWFRTKGSVFEPDMTAILLTAREVAAALAYLHDRNILHGDLTGNNVLLTASGKDKRHFVAKVSDFGLSRVLSGKAEVIQTRTYGTVTHMPPELVLEGQLSKAVDVYAFGVLLWEMYMGHRPFAGMTHGQVLHAVTCGKLLDLPSSAPPLFRHFARRCMAKEAKDRPTFKEILDIIDQLEYVSVSRPESL